MMVRRGLAGALTILHAGNAVYMLTDPRGWLSFVIGQPVAHAPPGVHFIYDVGLAFLASAVGFALFALRPNLWAAALVGAAFPLFHAIMHVMEMAEGHAPRLGFDLAAIVAPALLGLAIAWPLRKASSAS